MAIYQFGRCELNCDRHRLMVAGIERHIEPQVFDLLHFLAEKGDSIKLLTGVTGKDIKLVKNR